MTDYSKLTQQEFDTILLEVLEEHSCAGAFTIPGCYEPLAEFFNNEVLDRWAYNRDLLNGCDQ